MHFNLLVTKWHYMTLNYSFACLNLKYSFYSHFDFQLISTNTYLLTADNIAWLFLQEELEKLKCM